MKALFVPNFNGGKSHQIPLYVLYQRYFSKMDNVSSAFVLPGVDHQIFKNKNINVLDIDYSIPFPSNKSFSLKAVFKLLKEEEEIIKGYCPDIIIESLNFGTAAVSEKYEIPRISLQRTGIICKMPTTMVIQTATIMATITDIRMDQILQIRIKVGGVVGASVLRQLSGVLELPLLVAVELELRGGLLFCRFLVVELEQ